MLRGLTDLVDEEADVITLFESMMSAEDPRDAGSAWAEGMRRRHAGIARIVARLADAGRLRSDVDAARAADVIAALVTDDVCDVLVDQRGWSFDEYETWLRDTMRALVLDPSG